MNIIIYNFVVMILNQELLTELVVQGLVKNVTVSETMPSKGKALHSPTKKVWVVKIILANGNESCLLSTRGSQREWASLDRLTEWLRAIGLCKYHVHQLEALG